MNKFIAAITTILIVSAVFLLYRGKPKSQTFEETPASPALFTLSSYESLIAEVDQQRVYLEIEQTEICNQAKAIDHLNKEITLLKKKPYVVFVIPNSAQPVNTFSLRNVNISSTPQ